GRPDCGTPFAFSAGPRCSQTAGGYFDVLPARFFSGRVLRIGPDAHAAGGRNGRWPISHALHPGYSCRSNHKERNDGRLSLRAGFVAVLFTEILGLGVQASAQTPEQFYTGKTIDFVIGYPPGGSNDTFGRLLARHLSKHIPESPRSCRRPARCRQLPGGKQRHLPGFPRCPRSVSTSARASFPKRATGSHWEAICRQNAQAPISVAG